MTYWKNLLREIYLLPSMAEITDIFYCKYNVVWLRAATSFQRDNQVEHPLQKEILHGILTTHTKCVCVCVCVCVYTHWADWVKLWSLTYVGSHTFKPRSWQWAVGLKFSLFSIDIPGKCWNRTSNGTISTSLYE